MKHSLLILGVLLIGCNHPAEVKTASPEVVTSAPATINGSAQLAAETVQGPTGPGGVQGATGATGSSFQITSKMRCAFTDSLGGNSWTFEYQASVTSAGDAFATCSIRHGGTRTQATFVYRASEPEAQTGLCPLNVFVGDDSDTPQFDFTVTGVTYSSSGALSGYARAFVGGECESL